MSHWSIAIGKDGKPTSNTSEEVRRIVSDALDKGRILAIVLMTESGELAVPVFFGPDDPKAADLPDILMTVAAALRTARKSVPSK